MNNQPRGRGADLAQGCPEAVLAPHHDHCYVCGPANTASTGISFRQAGDAIEGHVVLDERHQGVPGLAHGGVIAAIMDEVAGTLLIAEGLRFVTVALEVQYLAPVVIGEALTAMAWLDSRVGRKSSVGTRLSCGDVALATARVVFVEVPAEHFAERGCGEAAALMFGTAGAR